MNEFEKQKLEDLVRSRIEACNGDPLEYMSRFNQHHLKISVIDGQLNEETWSEQFTFRMEDAALAHMSIVFELTKLLTNEENCTEWGFKHTDQKVVDRIIAPLTGWLKGQPYPAE